MPARASGRDGARAETPETPGRDCPLCPRLKAYRKQNRDENPDWHNAPVDSFAPRGDGYDGVRLLIVGLAPGRTGANRTGRPFTGDAAGEILYPALKRHGLAKGTFRARADDGFRLLRCRVTNAVRCAPPENRPTAAEVNTCRRFLAAEIAAPSSLRAILALGGVAHKSTLRALGLSGSAFPFDHGAVHEVEEARAGLILADSYHPSRYNMNTRRLTEAMFEAVIKRVSDLIT